MLASGPRFDAHVPPGGYAWWYVDALSDDGRYGVTLIAFIGSVFSPYYAWTNWRDPLDHCAVNVALYRLDRGARPGGGPGGGLWAMTERGRHALLRDATTLTIGPSALSWDKDALKINVDEVTAPIPRRLRGIIHVIPRALTSTHFALDADARHIWRPIAPRARVEVSLQSPDLRWAGDGYFDANQGVEPLERGFRGWEWGRAHVGSDALLFYDVAARNGDDASLALRVDASGEVDALEPLARANLPSTFWGIGRRGWAHNGAAPTVRKTLEDTPFYARSALNAQLMGRQTTMMHESLSLDRLGSPIIRAMLPFRMPRIFWQTRLG